MKGILALCAAALLAGGAAVWKATRLPNKFGEFENAPKASVTELVSRPKAYLKKTVAVDGVVREQCTTMGCYFFFHEDDKVLRVDLETIAMNAPKRKNGKRARVEGTMVPYGDGYQLAASAVEFE